MMSPRDYLMTITMNLSLSCGDGSPPALVSAFAEHVRTGCRSLAGVRFADDVTVDAWQAGDKHARPAVRVTLGVATVEDAADLLDDVATAAVEWWAAHPQYPLPTQPGVGPNGNGR